MIKFSVCHDLPRTHLAAETIIATKVMASCSRAPSPTQGHTPPRHKDRRGRSGQKQHPAHLQLSLESNMSTKGTRKSYAIYIKKDYARSSRKGFKVKLLLRKHELSNQHLAL